jgi:hypothetical protein
VLDEASNAAKANGNDFATSEFADGIGFFEYKKGNQQRIVASRNLKCHPDTVDPRGPKGK